MTFGKSFKGKVTSERKLLLLSRPGKYTVRFIGNNLKEFKVHYYNDKYVKCKAAEGGCKICKKGLKPKSIYVTPVIDRKTETVKIMRLPYSVLSILQAKEQSQEKFKKFYSYNHGRDIIIIVKRVNTDDGPRFDYAVYPGVRNKIKKELLKKAPKASIVFSYED
jgi:hypothetical protein